MVSSDPFSSAGDSATSGPVKNTREAQAKRDGYGRYLIPKLPKDYREQFKEKGYATPDSGDTAWTRVTTYAKSVSDTFGLSQWSQRMVAKGMGIRPDLVLSAAATPVTDKGRLDSIAEQAKDAAASRAAANLGDAYHNLTQDLDMGHPVDLANLPDDARQSLTAYGAVLNHFGLEPDPALIERCVVNTTFGVAGTFDRIMNAHVVDLKTGRDLSYGWSEIAIQLVCYATADAIWDWDRKVFLPMPAVNRSVGIVLHMPVGTGKVDPYRVNLEAAYAAAKLCGAVRTWRKIKGLATLVMPEDVLIPDYGTPPPASAGPSDVQDRAVQVDGETIKTKPLRVAQDEEQVPELAPIAGPGQKGCSVCRRTGHRKGSPKCLGMNDPGRTVFDNLPTPSEDVPADNQPNLFVGQDADSDARCSGHPGAGWTNRGDGVFVCGECGLRSPAIPTTLAEEVTDTEKTPIGEQDVPQAEEVPDPFAEPVADTGPTGPTVSWLDEINNAESKAEIRAIRDSAKGVGAWSPQLHEAALGRLTVLDSRG